MSGRPYGKGISGNPGGQTKAQVAMRRLAAELVGAETRGGAEIIEFALHVMRGDDDYPSDDKSRRWAADFLANRLWGRAPLTVEVSGPTEAMPLPDLRNLSIEELREMAAGAAAEAEEPAGDDPPGDTN